jgi:hypothetical protein
MTEDADLSFIRNRGAGHEVHEHLSGAGIESGHCHLLASPDHEFAQAKRSQALVVLEHAVNAKNRLLHQPPPR